MWEIWRVQDTPHVRRYLQLHLAEFVKSPARRAMVREGGWGVEALCATDDSPSILNRSGKPRTKFCPRTSEQPSSPPSGGGCGL